LVEISAKFGCLNPILGRLGLRTTLVDGSLESPWSTFYSPVTDGQTDRRTEGGICRSICSALRRIYCWCEKRSL